MQDGVSEFLFGMCHAFFFQRIARSQFKCLFALYSTNSDRLMSKLVFYPWCELINCRVSGRLIELGDPKPTWPRTSVWGARDSF